MLKSLSILSRFNHQYAASVNDLASHKHCGKGSGEFGEPQRQWTTWPHTNTVEKGLESLANHRRWTMHLRHLVFIAMSSSTRSRLFLRFALLLLLLIIVYFLVYSSKFFLPLLYFPDWASIYRYRSLSISSDLLVNWLFRDVCMFACALLLALDRLVYACSCINFDVHSCFELWSALSQSSWIRPYIRVTDYYYNYKLLEPKRGVGGSSCVWQWVIQ